MSMENDTAVTRAVQRERHNLERMRDAAEMLWITIANVSEGDWNKQSQDWRDVAARSRDEYHQLCKELNLSPRLETSGGLS